MPESLNYSAMTPILIFLLLIGSICTLTSASFSYGVTTSSYYSSGYGYITASTSTKFNCYGNTYGKPLIVSPSSIYSMGYGRFEASVQCYGADYSSRQCCIGTNIKDLNSSSAILYNGPTGYYLCLASGSVSLQYGSHNTENNNQLHSVLATTTLATDAHKYWTSMKLDFYPNGYMEGYINGSRILTHRSASFVRDANNMKIAVQTANGNGYYDNMVYSSLDYIPFRNYSSSGHGVWSVSDNSISVYSYSYGMPGVLVFNDEMEGYGHIQADVLCKSGAVQCCVGLGVTDLNTTSTKEVLYNGDTGYFFCIHSGAASLQKGTSNSPKNFWATVLASMTVSTGTMDSWTTVDFYLYSNGTLKGYLNNTAYELWHNIDSFSPVDNSYYALQTANGYAQYKNVMTFNIENSGTVPTYSPSRAPTQSPTQTPTTTTPTFPTETPTVAPTRTPSKSPTKTPSHAPSVFISNDMPTEAPTYYPTAAPTTSPTFNISSNTTQYSNCSEGMVFDIYSNECVTCSASILPDLTEEAYHQCIGQQLERLVTIEENLNRFEELFETFLQDVRYKQPTFPPTRSPTRRRISRRPTAPNNP